MKRKKMSNITNLLLLLILTMASLSTAHASSVQLKDPYGEQNDEDTLTLPSTPGQSSLTLQLRRRGVQTSAKDGDANSVEPKSQSSLKRSSSLPNTEPNTFKARANASSWPPYFYGQDPEIIDPESQPLYVRGSDDHRDIEEELKSLFRSKGELYDLNILASVYSDLLKEDSQEKFGKYVIFCGRASDEVQAKWLWWQLMSIKLAKEEGDGEEAFQPSQPSVLINSRPAPSRPPVKAVAPSKEASTGCIIS